MDVILSIISGRAVGRSHRIPAGGKAVLGRQEDCDFQVVEQGISRRHCQIDNKGSRVQVTDLGSSNGTFVNGRKVETCVLNSGDLLQLGLAPVNVRFQGSVSRPPRHTSSLAIIKEPQSSSTFEHRVVDLNRTHMSTLPPGKGALKSEDLARAHANLETLYQVGAAINAEQEMDKLFETVVESVLKVTEGERAALLTRHPDTGNVELEAIKHRYAVGRSNLQISRTVLDKVLKEGVSAISNYAAVDVRLRSQSLIDQMITGVMCVPVAGRSGTLGLLYVDTTSPDQVFRDTDLEILASIGSQAGGALERARLIQELEELFIGANRALVASVEARDPYTRGHSERVTAYSLSIAAVMGLDDRSREILELSGLLHDVGKIGVPEAVLQKAGKLTDEEFRHIKLHPVQGSEIVKNIRHPYIEEVVQGVRHHHERWSGGGYPDGLKGDDINLTSRILAVGDTYDAMTSDRPYRKGMPAEKAIAILQDISGSQLEPDVVEAFLKARSSDPAAGFDKARSWRSKYSLDPDERTSTLSQIDRSQLPKG